MVVALIALAVSLGGSAWAVTKVGTNQIRNGAVTTTKLKNGAVTTAKLRGGSVTGAKLGNGSVTGAKVAAGAIGEIDLLDGAVSGDKIAQTTIRAGNMRNNSVPGRAIQDAAVGNDQVGSGTLGADRLTAAARLSLKGALAYALVDPTAPSLVTGSTSGFSSVTRPGTGIYCLTPTPEVAALAFNSGGTPVRPLLATVEWGRTSVSAPALYPFVMPHGDGNGSCGAGKYEVHTENPLGTPSVNVGFIVAIP